MKIIAFYLPQFHEIEENNRLWGKGFTEWTNVKKARALFEGHFQPVEPLDNNYYDLTHVETLYWQAKLAEAYGIYGFCFYHYWYNGHLLLQKPIEIFLKNKEINIPFCLCWANHDWTTSWSDNKKEVIFRQNYTDKKEWKAHFDYFLPYLKDERYIKKDGKPLLIIYEAANILEMNDILDYWRSLACEAGLRGIEYAYQSATADTIFGFDDSRYSYNIEYQPQYARLLSYNKRKMIFSHTILDIIRKINYKTFRFDIEKIFKKIRKEKLTIYDYDDLWKRILRMGPITKKSIPGAFVKMDTTPRMGMKGVVTQGMTPGKFKYYLKEQIERAKDVYKQDMLFLFAWNEWAEGGYLEPDKQWGYGVLEAVKEALKETGEMPGTKREGE